MNLEPGKKTDVLVAEKVDGWERNGEILFRPDDNEAVDTENVHDVLDYIPPYSTFIAAAWKVLEKFDYYEVRYDKILKTYTCTITIYTACAKTAELAICLCALKAKGVKIND